eukprot:gene3631-4564_t
MGQLYGENNAVSMEWNDGVLSNAFRTFADDPDTSTRKWLLLDGAARQPAQPATTSWVPTVHFQSLANQIPPQEYSGISGTDGPDPAFMLRRRRICEGMVYVEPHTIGWEPLIASYMEFKLPASITTSGRARLQSAVDWLVPPSLRLIRKYCEEPVATLEIGLVANLIRLFDATLDEFRPPKPASKPQVAEGKGKPKAEAASAAAPKPAATKISNYEEPRYLDSLFLFSMGSRPEEDLGPGYTWTPPPYKVALNFPSRGQVYDYVFDKQSLVWASWLDTESPQKIPPTAQFNDIVVSSVDTIRYSYLVDLLLTHESNVLLVGPTGTGKTVYVKRKLASRGGLNPDEYQPILLNFSAQTSANQTQHIAPKATFTVAPFAPLTGGGAHLINAMGPPGGGRNEVTLRYMRHFNLLSITPFDDESLMRIFGALLEWWMTNCRFKEDITRLRQPLVVATIQEGLLPTPTKSHYTFNLRDVAKVMQGVTSTHDGAIADGVVLTKLWLHESLRIFHDRLISDEDQTMFYQVLRTAIPRHFPDEYKGMFPSAADANKTSGGSPKRRASQLLTKENIQQEQDEMMRHLLFGDFMMTGVYPKPYVEIASLEEVQEVVNQYLADYNSSATHLATYINEFDLFQVEVTATYSTMDWHEDLKLRELADVEMDPQIRTEVVSMCKMVHSMVRDDVSKAFFAEQRRQTYVTPMSYLELLGVFKMLLAAKRLEVTTASTRYSVGLNKLLNTADQVGSMSIELEALQPKLIQSSMETDEIMQVIDRETAEANKKKAVVEVEENEAKEKADASRAIKDDCDRELSVAMPILESAIKALNTLNKNDIMEVKGMQNPPKGVKLVMEAVCIMKGIKPTRVKDPNTGRYNQDYWESSKKMLNDVRFLESLENYEKDSIPPATIKAVQPYITNPDFAPDQVKKASKAAHGLSCWVIAIEKYDKVAKVVAPKKLALEEAESKLQMVMASLEVKRAALKEVSDKIAKLNEGLQESKAKKAGLEEEVANCTAKLDRASKLISGLGGEKARWTQVGADLGVLYTNLVGDMVLSAAIIAYMGPYTAKYREECLQLWVSSCRSSEIPCTGETYRLADSLGVLVDIRTWVINGLPSDNLSVDNAGQANKWVKNMGRQAAGDLMILKPVDKNLTRQLESALRDGSSHPLVGGPSGGCSGTDLQAATWKCG